MALLHGRLTKTLIGAFYDVYNDLGYGFLESVYERSFLVALEERGLEFARQAAIEVWFHDRKVGLFFADVLVEHVVIVELKTVRTLETAHESQVLNYLRATDVEVGLLLNFGPAPQFRRLVFANDRKAGRG